MRSWKPAILSVVIAGCLIVPSASAGGLRGARDLSKEKFLRQLAMESPKESNEALAAALPGREKALARTRREDVLPEVDRRARELKVTASPEELADLLTQRAWLQLDLDKCRVSRGTSCSEPASALQAVEASFRKLAGVSANEFQHGRKAPAAPAQRKDNWDPNHCTCSFWVYSSNRWMSPYWGLECNNHASHGVCSDNVDSAHSPGIGAMVGSVYVLFSTIQETECGDDHRTCFKGPSTSNPGEWGNVCSCDTWHSQYYDPYSAWYGGDLQDAEEIYQAYGGGLLDGECEGQYVLVEESIQEHDPICCDDPMGVLVADLPLHEGSGSSSAAVSAQNCNGGSQSGVPPYCGTFGATIRVAYSCQTQPDAETSCQGQCWSDPPDGNCSCSAGCVGQGTCCYDYTDVCCGAFPQYTGCWS
jgi:hypothetical protein